MNTNPRRSRQHCLAITSGSQHAAQWVYYGMYYYAQGMQKREPVVADKAKQVTEDVLLKLAGRRLQDDHDGMERSAGRIYCTALAMLSLSVKYHCRFVGAEQCCSFSPGMSGLSGGGGGASFIGWVLIHFNR